MRPWLLLVSLLISDLSPLEDADWITDYRPLLCRRKIHNKRQKIILSLTGFQRDCECVAVQDEQRSSVFYWPHQVHNDHGDTRQDTTGPIHKNQFPGLVCLLNSLPIGGEHVPAFLVKSNTPPALHIISETSHITMDVDKNRPDSNSVRLHHRSTASGHDFPTFLLEESKTVDAQLKNMLTSRNCTPKLVIVDVAQPQVRQKEITQPAVDIKNPKQYDGRLSSISQLDIIQSASMKTSDTSQMEDGVTKKTEHLNLGKSSALKKGLQKQLPLSTASSEDVDGSSAQKQLLLASRENKRSINRPQFEPRPARDPNNEYFSGKVITKECELTCLEGESEKEKSHRNGVENENQKSSQYTLQTHGTYQTDNVSLKPVVCDVGQDASIVLFLPEAETQTEPTDKKKPAPYTDVKWKSVKILKELDEPPCVTKTAKGCKFKGQCVLEMYTIGRRKTIDIKPVNSRYKTSMPKATTKTDNKPPKNLRAKEENMPSEESFTPSSVTPATMQTEMTTEGSLPETTIANVEIREPASAGVFSQVNPGGAEGPTTTNKSTEITMNPEPTTNYEPDIRDYITEMKETTTKTWLSGLRMREDLQDVMDKLHKEVEKERTSASWMEAGREAGHGNPGVVFLKPLEAVHKEGTDVYQKMTGDSVPLCGGLIQRTEAGWKRCMERFRQPASMMFPFKEAPDAGKLEEEPVRNTDHNPPSNDDENNHFYYFNGVSKRVQNNFYPDNKRQRRRSLDNTEERVTRERETGNAHGNLLSYIQSLNERNKVKHLK